MWCLRSPHVGVRGGRRRSDAGLGVGVGFGIAVAGRAAVAGGFAAASQLYGQIGATFVEAWAALLAAERGDVSRLDAALAYFEQRRATPYAERCLAVMQASA
jgi:hypothetical protein